jgi:FKBP-type peptidyl-prolyl cis-trans isomerase 2
MTKRGFIALLLVAIAVAGLSAGCGGGDPAVNGNTVKVHYTGTLSDGSEFDSSEGGEPLQFTLGANQMIPGFERAVYGMKVGQSKTVTIPMEEAYGPRNDDLIVEIQRSTLPAGSVPQVGQWLELTDASGRRTPAQIIELGQTTVTVDANHRLAGEALTFEIRMVEIR